MLVLTIFNLFFNFLILLVVSTVYQDLKEFRKEKIIKTTYSTADVNSDLIWNGNQWISRN